MRGRLDNIVANYRRYLSIPSLTDSESLMASQLLGDFESSATFMSYGCPVWLGDPNNNILFIAHMDRIKVTYIKPEFGKKTLVGQLDNAISIACLKTLKDQGHKFNVMFTTGEESCRAHQNVIDFVSTKQHHTNPLVVDCDIDVFYDEDDWQNSISLRSYDNVEQFSIEDVGKLRRIAEENDIPYSAKEDWLIGTAGFIRKYSDNKIRALYLGLPILNYHSALEVVDNQSLVNYYDMMALLSIGGV